MTSPRPRKAASTNEPVIAVRVSERHATEKIPVLNVTKEDEPALTGDSMKGSPLHPPPFLSHRP